jgi:hypothetical protein
MMSGAMTTTNRDRVMELAEKVLQLEAEINILNAKLDVSRNPQLQIEIQNLLNAHLSSEKHLQRVLELATAFRVDTGDDALIRTLHEEILRRATVI